MLDSAGGAGAATIVVVAMDGETGSPNVEAYMTECMVRGGLWRKVVPRGRDSASPVRGAEKTQWRRNSRMRAWW